MIVKNFKRLITLIVLSVLALLSFINMPTSEAAIIPDELKTVLSVRPSKDKIWVIYDDGKNTFITDSAITDGNGTGNDYTNNKIIFSSNGDEIKAYDFTKNPISSSEVTLNFTREKVDGYEMHVTGWRLKAVLQNGNIINQFIAPIENDYSDMTNAYKDIDTVYAQEGFYIVPNGVTAIAVEPVFGKAIYVRSPYDKMYYDEFHIFIYGENADGKKSNDYYDNPLLFTGTKPAEIAQPKSAENNNGKKPIHDGTQDGPIATLKRAYELIPNTAHSVYDYLLVLCGDMYEVSRVEAGSSYVTGVPAGTIYNYYNRNFAYTSDTNKACTITSVKDKNYEIDGVTGYYHLYPKPNSYDFTNSSSLRLDNLNVSQLPSGNVKAIRNAGKTASSFTRVRQFNFSNNKTFETTETVKSNDTAQIRLNSAKSFKFLGGNWNPVYAYSSANSTLNNNSFILVGGKAYCSYVSNHACAINNPEISMVLNNPPDIIVTGGKVGSFGSATTSNNGIYGSGVVVNSNVGGKVNIFISGGAISNVYGAGFGSVVKYKDECSVNIKITGGKINYIYGAGQYYTSVIEGDVNLSLASSYDNRVTITGNIYGGGKGGKVNGNVNLSIDKVDVKTNSFDSASGKVFGGGFGLIDSISYTNAVDSSVKDTAAFATAVEKFNTSTRGNRTVLWAEAPKGFPVYNKENDEIISRIYHTASKTNGYWYLYEKVDKVALTLAEIAGDVNLSMENSTVAKDLYGGGSISQVLGNIDVDINNSTIGGIIYGGGDGVTKLSTVTLCKPITGTYEAISGVASDAKTSLGNFSLSDDVDILTHFDGIYDGKNKYLFDPVTGHPKSFNTGLTSAQQALVDKYGEKQLIYGAINQKDLGYVRKDIDLSVTNTKVSTIYGGGNQGYIGGSTCLTINSSNGEIITAYAGSNQADIDGNSTLILNGGLIDTAFGGGNQGVVLGNITVITSGNTLEVNNLYGAANKADVGGNVLLTIGGGTFTYIFGGNNLSGDIGGDIKINITNANISALYGGGNQAVFNNKSAINFKGGNLVIDNSIADNAVYGGGKEAYAKETAVNIYNGIISSSIYGGGYVGDVDSASVAVYGGTINKDIYGGGLNGDVKTTQVLIAESIDSDANPIIPAIVGTVYGGGQDGMVTTKTQVNISGGIFNGDIYGGGKGQTATTLATGVEINGAQVDGTVYGGGNLGVVTSNIEVRITDSEIGKIYGGGNLAQVDGLTKVIVDGNSIINNELFGGGNLANVSDTEIIINDGTFNNCVYGGGNQGQVDNDTRVTINNGHFNSNVYGGGFQGNIAKNVSVNIFGGSFDKSIYGGGYAGQVTTVNMNIKDYDEYNNVTPIIVADSVFAGGEGLTATVIKTKLTIDFKLTSTVKEELESEKVDSSAGQAKITFDPETNINTQSKILGSVYGGGDLAKVGDGTINMSSNEATFIAEGSTEVLVLNAYVGDSVFAGGRGVAPLGMSYSVYMGTVFGMTEVTVNSGYIGGSVYGGGRESRVYAKNDIASVVNLVQTNAATDNVQNDYNLVIGNSVFGGGDRGTGEATNASVPTTIGDIIVNITGCETGTAIYFLDGGVYGDGNLCLVDGDQEINMTNFTTGQNGKLKTFYSLQRADVVNLSNTDIVLLGAIDKVEEGDDTIYSINRISTLNLCNGSTVKLSTIVKCLSTVYSDYKTADNTINPDRIYVNHGNNGSNGYGTLANPDFLSETEIAAYRESYETYLLSSNNNPQNTISVANGLYLELKNLDGTYGKVVGLFTLQLLVPTPGEGGGLVYADIPTSTGDFICVTRFASSGNGASEYMNVLDDVCRLTDKGYTAYFWYIAGTRINYQIAITGYIGSTQPSYTETVTIPRFNEGILFMLYAIELGDDSDLKKSITSIPSKPSDYTLITNKDDLTGNNIAIEVCYGKNSLGFLYYDQTSDRWGLYTPTEICYGYGHEDGMNTIEAMEKNIIYVAKEKENDTSVDLILHKSPEVNVEYNNLNFNFQINMFVKEDGDSYTPLENYTNELFFICDLAIRRLVPIQSNYASTGHLYSGVTTNMNLMGITSNSSFTMQTTTRYIPGAFPQVGAATISWFIKAETYNYYFDSVTSSFLVTDIDDKAINYSENFVGCFTDGVLNLSNAIQLTKVGNHYTYKHGSKGEIRTLTKVSNASRSFFPKGTTITLIDVSEEKYVSVYYYVVTEENVVAVNLLDFMQMGSNIKIKDLNDKPYFMDLYNDSSKANVRITENLIFIFDFTNVINNSSQSDFIWNSKSTEDGIYDQFSGSISLAHLYQGKDIMDYVKTPESEHDVVIKEYPRYSDFIISNVESGIKDFEADFREEEYYSSDEYYLNIEIAEDDYWHNTEYKERKFAAVIELIDSNGNVIKMPEGMSFKYQNSTYYSKDGGKSVIVPFGNSGTHQIIIDNYMYGLYEHLFLNGYDLKDSNNNYKVTFRLTAYSSVTGDYYNEMLVNIKQITTSFVVKENTIEAMSVKIADNIVKAGEDIELTVETYQDQTVTVEVYKKVRGSYSEDVTNKFMPMGNTYAAFNGQSNEIIITVSNEIETGTYQFIVKIGKYREIITVIVVNDSSANSN